MNNSQNKNNIELSDAERLQLLHSYILSLVEKGILPKDKNEIKLYFSNAKHRSDDAELIFKYISDLYGCGGFPQIVSNQEYKNLDKQELFRGSNNIEHIANSIVDFDRHYGWGMIANGMHSAEKFDYALNFTANGGSLSKELVLKFKLDAKPVSITTLLNEYNEARMGCFRNSPAKNKLKTLMEFFGTVASDRVFDAELYHYMFSVDAGKLAIVLGYSALSTGNYRSIVVLNRNKMIISKAEYNRIIKKSKKYNSGFVNLNEQNQPGSQ